MNIRDLNYLIAVANFKHFGKAAEACFVSQPALSMQLQKLEDNLGVQLFERTNKHVMITKIGLEIIERAKNIIQEVNDIKEIAQQNKDPLSGELKLGIFPSLGPYYLPLIIPKITKSFPNLKLFLVEEKTNIIINKLKDGEIDAAFLALPLKDELLESASLFQDEFFLAVSKNHSLAKLKSISYKDLKNEKLLLLEDGHCLREQALNVCSLIGAHEYQTFRATSLETLRHMVAANVGATLIPKIAKKSNDGIKYLPFTNSPPSRTIGLVWRKTSAKFPACKKLIHVIHSCSTIS